MRSLARRVLMSFTLACVAGPAAAQSVFETAWSDLKTAPGDIWYVWSSPARIDGDDLPKLLGFAGVTALVMVSDESIQSWIRDHEHVAVIEMFDPFSQSEGEFFAELGRNHQIMRAAGVGYVVGLVADWDWLREASLGCAVTNTANALPRSLLYKTVSRTRPSGETDAHQWDVPGGEWSEHSFFGGHGANVFGCASFFSNRWDLGWGEPALYALATGIAIARTTSDEAHWTSDTLVGAVYGWGIGWMVAKRYVERDRERRREQEGRSEPSLGLSARADLSGFTFEGVNIRPVQSEEGSVLVLGARLRF